MAYYNGPRRKKKVDKSIVRSRTTSDDFENAKQRALGNEEKKVMASGFIFKNGIPHKLVNGILTPLTKLS